MSIKNNITFNKGLNIFSYLTPLKNKELYSAKGFLSKDSKMWITEQKDKNSVGIQ
jgi:hypothetical protein